MTRPLSVLLVDDVALARHRLRALLARIPQVRVDAEAASLDQARQMLLGRRFDLLLLDLLLPDGRGWELPAQQPSLAAHTVFVTALPQHALHAFELGVADYLLKPVAMPRLQEAITRARRLAGLGDDGESDAQALPVPASTSVMPPGPRSRKQLTSMLIFGCPKRAMASARAVSPP